MSSSIKHHHRQVDDLLPEGGEVGIDGRGAARQPDHRLGPALPRVERLSDPVEAPLKQSSRLSEPSPGDRLDRRGSIGRRRSSLRPLRRRKENVGDHRVLRCTVGRGSHLQIDPPEEGNIGQLNEEQAPVARPLKLRIGPNPGDRRYCGERFSDAFDSRGEPVAGNDPQQVYVTELIGFARRKGSAESDVAAGHGYAQRFSKAVDQGSSPLGTQVDVDHYTIMVSCRQGAVGGDVRARRRPSGQTLLMSSFAGELCELLPADPASVGRARRLVATAIAATGHDELVDLATLLVSEVVTNSVLHAGTEMRLTCRSSGAGIRVEVFDRSSLVPSVRHYDADATTGRGLGLVSALATSWGVDCEDDGKTLWFELDVGSAGGEGSPWSEPVIQSPPPEPALEVQLCGASPPLVQATIEHGDALLRELALLALGGQLDDALPQGWQLPQFDVSQILAAAEAATAAMQAKADLNVGLPAGADAAATERLRLVDHADTLAREGRLLCAPALPEVAVCRHWLYSQIAEQAAGFAPQAWELPEPLEPARSAAGLPADELERLRRATAATVVADDANRIIFVNQAAGELLGWAPEALVGQRLTVLIPPELREAHLAGFSRLQVTGQPRILGVTVLVPALRRDGWCVEVALTIERLAGCGGRSAFRAVLAQTADASSERPSDR